MAPYELHQAVKKGDLRHVSELLSASSSEINERDRNGRTPLMYAVSDPKAEVKLLRTLLHHGASLDQGNIVSLALRAGDPHKIAVLLEAGANIRYQREHGYDALIDAAYGRDGLHNPHLIELLALLITKREIILHLLQAGADPLDLTFDGQREILGYPTDLDMNLLEVYRDEFLKDRSRRFGTQNPEKMNVSFWEGMIRSGMDAYHVQTLLGDERDRSDAGYMPVWCAQRFGQSMTILPDNRIVQVAGEHEDSYDQDFCIYNDVFVHDSDGKISIYGYPREVFPPTDFHTATLIGDHIYLIGSLGYSGTRHYGETPVYRLDTNTFHVERLETTGNKPGWIYNHRAIQSGIHEIQVSGGTVLTVSDGREISSENGSIFILDIEQRVWRVGLSVPC